VLEKLKVKNVLNVYFAARFILSSNSNNCCLLYFNANAMCCFTKKLKLLRDLSPRPPTRAPPLDPAGELPSPRYPVFFYIPLNDPMRSTPLAYGMAWTVKYSKISLIIPSLM